MGAFAKKVRDNYKIATSTRTRIEVPEWDIEFFVGPITLRQQSEIAGESDDLLRAAKVVFVLAKKEDGSPFFDAEDFDVMCGYGVGDFGARVMLRVAQEVSNAASPPTVDQTVKN